MESDDSEYDWKSFVVVRAFENDKHDCIPSNWLVFDEEYGGRAYQTTVTYQFPSRAKLGKGLKFKKNQRPNIKWPEFDGKMLLVTDSQAEAFRYIKYAKAQQKKIKEDDCRYTSSSSDTSESDSEEENPPKRSGTKRKQSDQENNKNIRAKSKKNADKLDKKLESEKIEAETQLHSHCYNFYVEFNALYQKSMSILDNTADYLQKIISTYKNNAAVKANLSSPLPTNQQHDDETQNDGKWTLRYPEPGPGITELMPNTGVYISEKGLSECKIKYITTTTFTRGLLEEVFTDEAIEKCSYTGQPPRSYRDRDRHPTKPGLDLNARQTLVDYVLKYSCEKGWLYGDTNTVKDDTARIIICIKGRLNDAYQKSNLLHMNKKSTRTKLVTKSCTQ